MRNLLVITVGVNELEAYQAPSQLIKVINCAFDPALSKFLEGPRPLAGESDVLFDSIRVSMN